MPPTILLPAMLLLFSASAASSMPVLTEPYPFAVRLAVTAPQGEVARVVEDCGVTSSRTGGFGMPRRYGSHLFGLLCETESGGLHLRVFDGSDLSLLCEVEGSAAMTVRLVPQGLQVADGEDILIWYAPDEDYGSSRFREANGEASGLRLTLGEVMPPRLQAQDYGIARNPLEPLRLGPRADAPYFSRASTHLLVHFSDDASAFWSNDGFARVCIPDGGCGYIPEEQLQSVDSLDDNPEASALAHAAFGPPSAEFGCWPRLSETDGVLFCLRPQRIFTGVGSDVSVRVLVMAGMGFEPDGPLLRCHACPAGLGLIVAEADRLQAMPLYLIGSWGRGPAEKDIALVGAEGDGWHVVVHETFSERGAIVESHHLFGMIGDRPAPLGILPGAITRFVEVGPNLLSEERDGWALQWVPLQNVDVAPRLVPVNGEGDPILLRRDLTSGLYPRVYAP